MKSTSNERQTESNSKVANVNGEIPTIGDLLRDRPLVANIKQTATVLNISTRTVRRLIANRRLKVIPGIRAHRIPWSEIERFVNTAE